MRVAAATAMTETRQRILWWTTLSIGGCAAAFLCGLGLLALIDLVSLWNDAKLQLSVGSFQSLLTQEYWAMRRPLVIAALLATLPPARAPSTILASIAGFLVFPINTALVWGGTLGFSGAHYFVNYFTGPLILPKSMWVHSIAVAFGPPVVVIIVGRAAAWIRDARGAARS